MADRAARADSHPPLRVVRPSPDWEGEFEVKVHEPGKPLPKLDEILAWIGGYEGVSAVHHEAAQGTITLRYDERRGARRILEGALNDRISALRARKRQPPRPIDVSIVHSLPGRIRLRVTTDVPEVIERLGAFIASLPGVERERVALASSSVLVNFDPKLTGSREILDAIAATPPSAWPAGTPDPPPAYVEWVKTGLNVAVLGAAITGLVPKSILIGAAAVNALPPLRRSLRSLARGRLNVDVMDATAIAVSLAQSQPIAASVITTLLAVGDLILDRTAARARTSISHLLRLDDGEAYVLEDTSRPPRRCRPRDLRAGMRIVVYPGARVPADGSLVEGALAVDEKALTGESTPREVGVGDAVMAATVAVQGQAVIEVERAGGDTVAARIVQILEGAGVKPMTLQRNAEKYADRLVLPTFAAAGAAFAFSGAIDRLTSVLITDFGTGVRIGVPTAALSAMIEAARAGVLVKGAQFLERLAEADTIVFDKTGTLTVGAPEIVGVVTLNPTRFDEREVVALAAAAEAHLSHPIAHAIRRHALGIGARTCTTDTSSEVYQIGLGLEARIDGRRVHVGSRRMMRELGIDVAPADPPIATFVTRGASSVLVAIDGVLAGVVGYADAPRPESAAVIERLRDGGRRRVILLSGDATAPVEAIARQLGIDQAIAEVLPQQKADVVRALKAEGRKVAMVGDGINDAPALAIADIGISLRGGTEVALETADVVLLEGGLERLPEVFAISERAMRRVKEVLGVVLVPNAVGILAGAFGLLGPVGAAVINNGSTIVAAMHAAYPLLRRRSNGGSGGNGNGAREGASFGAAARPARGRRAS